MRQASCCFFFNDTATTEIYTLSLHDALPISPHAPLEPEAAGAREDEGAGRHDQDEEAEGERGAGLPAQLEATVDRQGRSEEHTSELQSRQYLVCRLLLEKKNIHLYTSLHTSI